MKFSISEFAWGHSGVILQCFIPFSSMYFLISSLVNGGPLLLWTISSIPWVENILSIFDMIALAIAEISTSGNCECASMITKRYSPVGNGP